MLTLLAASTATGDLPWYKSGALGYMLPDDAIIAVVMWGILFLAILGLGVVIERARVLLMLPRDDRVLRGQVLELLRGDRVDEALELCYRTQGPIAAILAAGLRKYAVLRRLGYDAARVEEQVVKAMDDFGVHVVAALERHLPVLATVSSVAPMLGSVGTVAGMIVLFQGIVAKFGTSNIIIAAAEGIQGKLVTTLFGLIVGIGAYVAYNYFSTVINSYVLEVEESASELIEAVTLQVALQQQQTGGRLELANKE
jgi:biopolymer transport protein ExbB